MRPDRLDMTNPRKTCLQSTPRHAGLPLPAQRKQHRYPPSILPVMTELPVSNTCPSSFAGLVIPIASQPPTDKPPAPTILYSWREIHPNAQFHYIRQHEEANNALERLEFGVYGFDIEWKPTFRKGQPENPVSLIQIANHEVILLLQVSAMRGEPTYHRIST